MFRDDGRADVTRLVGGWSSRGYVEKVPRESLKRREAPTKCFKTALFEGEERLDRIAVAVGAAESTGSSLQPREFATLWTYER
jgi:hypothetical protein